MNTTVTKRPGREAVLAKGWLAAHKWLLLRRISQFGILALFLAGPWLQVWIVKGNLSSSLTLGILPLTDPFIFLQSLAALHWPETQALIGVAVVTGFYLLVGGRVYCAWVCPVNVLTDSAAWLRRRLGIKTGRAPTAATRWWLLAGTLAVAAVTGSLAWELVNPVSLLHRGLLFGMGLGWLLIAAVFLFDLLIASRGWCGHVCPMGACYALLGKTALLRVSAVRRNFCNDCLDCFAVCPEPQVIRPALKKVGQESRSSLFRVQQLRSLHRVCSKDVFRFATRFDQRSGS